MNTHRAAVIVSGGDAISPFTTPTEGCGSGLAAGSTDTAIRDALLSAGIAVYTSPATAGPGLAEADPGFAGFADPPVLLPESLTVNAVGPIDAAGERLAAFLAWLGTRHGVTEVDLVGHSMGGLFSRAAIRELRRSASPVRVRSLVTIGTPWQGGFAADVASGDLDASTAGGDPGTETIMREFTALVEASSSGAGEQVTGRFLMGPDGWNAQQVGVLDDIPVTLIAGDHFQHPDGDPAVWPHDGLVTRASATAAEVPTSVLPRRVVHVLPDVHSVYFADQFGLPWERALTWDPVVLALVTPALIRREAT